MKTPASRGVLELPVEALAHRGAALHARVLGDPVRLRRREERPHVPARRVEERVREVVRVLVVRHPAPDEEVRVPAGLRVEIRLHVRRHDLDLDAQLLPDCEEGGRQSLVTVLQDRMHGRRDLDGRHQAGPLEEGERLVLLQERAPAAGVVAEDAGRRIPVAGTANRPSVAHTKSWLRVTPARARRSATFFPSAPCVLKSAKYVPFFGVSTRPARRRASLRSAVEVLRGKVARELDVAGEEAGADRRCAHSRPEPIASSRAGSFQWWGLRSRTTRSAARRATTNGPCRSRSRLRSRARS